VEGIKLQINKVRQLINEIYVNFVHRVLRYSKC